MHDAYSDLKLLFSNIQELDTILQFTAFNLDVDMRFCNMQ